MKTSSIDYWNRRWAEAPGAFETSWPDHLARELELQYVKWVVAGLPKDMQIVELGCGNFGLAEDRVLVEYLRSRYRGIDGSEAAIEAACSRNLGDGFDFSTADLTTDLTHPRPNQFLLTKRTIQNIAPEAREKILPLLREFAHGLMIEDLADARHETDTDRCRLGRDPLDIPSFNWPLTAAEHDMLKPCTVEPFMGWFYAMTRVFPDLPEKGREAAFEMSSRAIREGSRQPLRGPVVAIYW